MIRKNRFAKNPKKLILAVLFACLAIGVLAYYHRINSPRVSPIPTATINKLPVQQVPSEKKPTPSGGINQGTSKDNNGVSSTPITSQPGQWTQSVSGVITVKQPLANSTLKNGDSVSGSAGVSRVQYRLIDNQVGVISQGFISVVGGNFSATISFTPHSSSGRLDVFSTDQNGKEINEVQLPVNF